MIVYDVVQIVSTGAFTSHPPGRWWDCARDDEDDAQRMAGRYNQHVAVDGVKYVVERHDADCVGRASPCYNAWRDYPNATECECGGKRLLKGARR